MPAPRVWHRAHTAMHHLAGFPSHTTNRGSHHGGRHHARLTAPHPRLANPSRPPRVLVTWQGWIARRLGRSL